LVTPPLPVTRLLVICVRSLWLDPSTTGLLPALTIGFPIAMPPPIGPELPSMRLFEMRMSFVYACASMPPAPPLLPFTAASVCPYWRPMPSMRAAASPPVNAGWDAADTTVMSPPARTGLSPSTPR
jgi:hypothetical protein